MLGQGRRRRTSRTLVTLLSGGLLLVLGTPAAQAAVSISDAQVSESNGATTAVFTVTRTAGLLAGPATVHVNTADGSAHAPADYTAISADLVFDSVLLGGVQTQTVPVTVTGDRLDEATESFRVVLSGSPEVVDGEGVASIADDDPPPSVAVADAPAAAEGATASFAVVLSAPSGRNITVFSATADGAAIAGEDYAAHSGAVVIPAGATSAAVGVGLLDDAFVEAEESFELRIASAQFATLGRAAATATIVDDDAAPPPTAPVDAAPPAEPGAGADAGTGAPAAEAPAATDPVAVTALPRLGLSSPRLRHPSIILVTVSCPRETTRCSGRVTIFSRANPRSKLRPLRRERRLGRRNFTLAPGKTRTLTIALTKTDRILLLRTGRMLVRAFAVTTDTSGRSSVRRATGTLIARTSHS